MGRTPALTIFEWRPGVHGATGSDVCHGRQSAALSYGYRRCQQGHTPERAVR
jgi:hypothetical protein